MFCGCAGHLDEFCFRHKRIEKRCSEYARNSYHDELFDLTRRSYSRVPPRSYSRALPHTFSRVLSCFSMDLTIAHMVLVHERTTFCLDALVTAHVFPVLVTVFHVGLIFLLEGPTPTLS
jgi:hypothetical protein